MFALVYIIGELTLIFMLFFRGGDWLAGIVGDAWYCALFLLAVCSPFVVMQTWRYGYPVYIQNSKELADDIVQSLKNDKDQKSDR